MGVGRRDRDNLLSGLIVTGILPVEWSVPQGVTLTIPPRELALCTWPTVPPGGGIMFVNENPSVLAAGVDTHPGVRIICTSGTPSELETAAVGLIAAAGWQVLVRADFDVRGLQHVTRLLATAAGSQPWRWTPGPISSACDAPPASPPLRGGRCGTRRGTLILPRCCGPAG